MIARRRLRRWGLWGWGLLAALLCLAFLRSCVRIVPADAPIAAPLPEPAQASASGGLLLPVAGVRPAQLTDTFAQARADGRVHDAIDIMAPRGRAVLAAADGRVEKLFWSIAGGRTLYQRSGDGRRLYYYAHLDSYGQGVREGAAVTRGQRIGTVGSTGNASDDAPHLHFAVHEVRAGDRWYEGRPVDPYPLLARAR